MITSHTHTTHHTHTAPVTFVDYYRADYIPPTEAALIVSKGGGIPRPEDYHFYFVFIRENTAAAASGTEVSD